MLEDSPIHTLYQEGTVGAWLASNKEEAVRKVLGRAGVAHVHVGESEGRVGASLTGPAGTLRKCTAVNQYVDRNLHTLYPAEMKAPNLLYHINTTAICKVQRNTSVLVR